MSPAEQPSLSYFHPLSSNFIHFHPISSTSIHFHPLSSTVIHFHPLSLTFIHPPQGRRGVGDEQTRRAASPVSAALNPSADSEPSVSEPAQAPVSPI